jgi:hypothetical protein
MDQALPFTDPVADYSSSAEPGDVPRQPRPQHRYACAGIEPSIEEMLADPIVHLVMARDGITEQDVRRGIRKYRQVDGKQR